MIKLIVFDLDDTLYPEATFVESGFRAVSRYVCRRFSIDEKRFFRKLKTLLAVRGRGKIFDFALKNFRIYDKNLVPILVEVYRSHTPRIILYSGTARVLRVLGKKYNLAILTDGLPSVQRRKILALKLEKYVDLFVYTNDYGEDKAKPHPYAFKMVVRHFGVRPEEALYVGNDPRKDFIGAKRLGIKTARVKQGAMKKLVLNKKYEAEYIIGDIKKLPNLTDALNSPQK